LATTVAPNAAVATLEEQTYNGVPYLSGGVGENERDLMRQSGDAFNLWLWFVLKGTPNYLADLRVLVIDAKGNPVVDVVSDGPWLFAKLPPGKYTIRLPDGSQRPVSVGLTGRTLSIVEVTRPEESIS
jgi:hypothetical protein